MRTNMVFFFDNVTVAQFLFRFSVFILSLSEIVLLLGVVDSKYFRKNAIQKRLSVHRSIRSIQGFVVH